MIEFISTLPDYGSDTATSTIWEKIRPHLDQYEGICFYKYPIIQTASSLPPDLTIISHSCRPAIVRCLGYGIDDIDEIDTDELVIGGNIYDSPLLELEDLSIELANKFERERTLRKRTQQGDLSPVRVLGLPLIRRHEFEAKFGHLDDETQATVVLFLDDTGQSVAQPLDQPLDETEWRHVFSNIQGVNTLRTPSRHAPHEAPTLGDAIKILERNIALLDEEQLKAALQIAPGPQRIRGLAGTGKTVLLAIKAANIHLRFPEKKILFTFNTQSLYNHVKTLITKLYRVHSHQDPDWDKLHIRHAWGGVSRPGVYDELCSTLDLTPYNYTQIRNSSNPFRDCCRQVLKHAHSMQPTYHYILVDEAQDFPKEFFHLLYKLSHDPHRICWAYDELQSLSKTDFPPPEELFGTDDEGKPLVSLRGDPYPGQIEKDFVLHKSYRCPQQVFMLAHAIGLGLYSPKGCVQILEKAESWQAIGYHIEDGELRPGEDVTIYRPPENSPNTIADIYHGQQNVVTTKVFAERDEEIAWIAQAIKQDIEVEHVAPENIFVICLKALEMRTWLPRLQKALFDLDVASTIPGVNDTSSSFTEKGRVTLSTMSRTKGNEAYIVYIFSFETLYDYVNAVDHRNRAFTAISRSKAWVRITGIGDRMQQAQNEIDRILAHLPRFHFTFPDMDDIRRLDAETEKRRREFKQATETFQHFQGLDPAVIDDLVHAKPELLGETIQSLLQKLDPAVIDNLVHTKPELLGDIIQRLQEAQKGAHQ